MHTGNPLSWRARLVWIVAFAAAFGVVEAMVVVYIRTAFYPGGFEFPLVRPPDRLVILELCREAATLLMLVSVAALAARRFWERFAYFIAAFGVWDIVYYVWLRIAIGWPVTILDPDILFLIPLPWIAPVLAPVLIAIEMIVFGALIARRFGTGGDFRPGRASWAWAIAGTAAALWSFMADTGATLGGEMPGPYPWPLLAIALICYGAGFAAAWRNKLRQTGRES